MQIQLTRDITTRMRALPLTTSTNSGAGHVEGSSLSVCGMPVQTEIQLPCEECIMPFLVACRVELTHVR